MFMVDRLTFLLRQVYNLKKLQRWRPELMPLVAVCLIASGLWAFVELADEVLGGEAHSFDRTILLGLRSPNDPNDPIGPRWLEEVVLDLTAFGGEGVISFIVMAAVGFLFIQRKYRTVLLLMAASIGSAILSFSLKSRLRPSTTRSGIPFGLHHLQKLPQWPCPSRFGNLSYPRRAAGQGPAESGPESLPDVPCCPADGCRRV